MSVPHPHTLPHKTLPNAFAIVALFRPTEGEEHRPGADTGAHVEQGVGERRRETELKKSRFPEIQLCRFLDGLVPGRSRKGCHVYRASVAFVRRYCGACVWYNVTWLDGRCLSLPKMFERLLRCL